MEDVGTHGPLALSCITLGSLATLAYTLQLEEPTNTSRIRPKQTNKLNNNQQQKKHEEQILKEEMTRRTTKLSQLSDLASNALDSGRKGSVKFKEMFEACVAVRSLDRRNPELGKSFKFAAALLLDELRDATKQTVEGKRTRFKTGEDVSDLLKEYNVLFAMCRGLVIDREQKIELWNQVAELRRQSWCSQVALWKMRVPDVVKAFSILLLGRRFFPWIMLSSIVKIASQCLAAVVTLYKAEALETFRRPGFTNVDVFKALRATMYVQLSTIVLQVVGERLKHVGMMGFHHRLRTEVYSAMLLQDLEWYRLGQQDQRDVYELFGRVFALPGLTDTLVNFLLGFVEMVAGLAATGALIRKRSSGYMLLMVLLEVLCQTGCSILEVCKQWVQDIVKRQMTKVERNWIEPLVPENLTTVRSCAAEEKVLNNWNMFWKAEHKMNKRLELAAASFHPFAVMCREGTWASEMYASGTMVRTGQIRRVGDVQALNELAFKVGGTIWTTARSLMDIREIVRKLARTYEIIAVEPTIGLEKGHVPTESHAKGSLEFRSVCFSYPEASDVLDGINFSVPAKSICGLTGCSGAGKSTILLLLQRFYDPTKGTIFLDGIDISTLNPVWLRRQIAVVSQRPRMFSIPLLDNLIFGCEQDPTMAEIEEACRAACIFDLVHRNPSRFPLGLHTRVSNETLSGGELQRVAIARALLMNRPILLLDEATSALDSQSQAAVKEGLRNLKKGRTSIIVAHRLETLKEADNIICLEAGKICEHGTHEHLVTAGGLYSRLYQEQIQSTIAGESSSSSSMMSRR